MPKKSKMPMGGRMPMRPMMSRRQMDTMMNQVGGKRKTRKKRKGSR